MVLLHMTRIALACSALVLTGCMTMDGPCQLDVERDVDAGRVEVHCETGGAVTIVAPGGLLERAGRAISGSRAASAP